MDIQEKLWDGSYRVDELVRHDDVSYKLNKPIEYSAKCTRLAIDESNEDWPQTADKWLITINNEVFDYYTGVGLRKNNKPKKPSLSDVLSSMVYSKEACQNSFEDWADLLEYDTDSIKAFNIYRDCQKQSNKLNKAGIYFNDELTEFFSEF